MLDAAHILRLHDQANAHWHDPSAPAPQTGSPGDPSADSSSDWSSNSYLSRLILDQHRANFDLWHCEDEARDPLASDHTLAEVKRSIDRLNQSRNDLAERVDLVLLAAHLPAETQHPDRPLPPLHSETPGLMIDRLSILSLKIFHTAQETRRFSATPEHRDRNSARLLVLNLQRTDLAACLDQLWADVLAHRRRFKLYRQLKMYNDPSLNPVLYGKPSPSTS